jgi:hypothetical protein
MKYILISLAILTFSCNPCKRLSKIAKKNPQCLEQFKDTVIKEIHVPGFQGDSSKNLHTDTNYIDSILYNYRDTCIPTEKVKDIILSNSKRFIQNDSLITSDSLITLKSWLINGVLGHAYKVHDRTVQDTTSFNRYAIKDCPEPKFKWYAWLFIGIIIGLLLSIIFNKIIQ